MYLALSGTNSAPQGCSQKLNKSCLKTMVFLVFDAMNWIQFVGWESKRWTKADLEVEAASESTASESTAS